MQLHGQHSVECDWILSFSHKLFRTILLQDAIQIYQDLQLPDEEGDAERL